MKFFSAIRPVFLILLLPFAVRAELSSPPATTPEGVLERARKISAVSAGEDAVSNENSDTLPAVLSPGTMPGEKSFFRGLQMLMPLSGFFEYRLPADVEGGRGKMSSRAAGASVAGRYVGEDTIFYGSFDYRFTRYHFNAAETAPFGDTNALRWYGRYEQRISGPWGIFFDGALRMAADTNAALDEGLTGRIGGGVKFSWSRSLSFYAGVQALTQLEQDPLVVPFIGLDWQISRRWSLQISNGVNLIYDVWGDRTLRLDLGCMYLTTDCRLTPENSRGRALEIQEVPLVFSVTQELWRRGYVKAAVTGVLWSDYRFHSDDDTISDFDVDASVVFSIEAGIRF